MFVGSAKEVDCSKRAIGSVEEGEATRVHLATTWKSGSGGAVRIGAIEEAVCKRAKTTEVINDEWKEKYVLGD